MTVSAKINCESNLAHKWATLFFEDGEQLLRWKGVYYTPRQFEEKFPKPSDILKVVAQNKNKLNYENPDKTKDWMHK